MSIGRSPNFATVLATRHHTVNLLNGYVVVCFIKYRRCLNHAEATSPTAAQLLDPTPTEHP